LILTLLVIVFFYQRMYGQESVIVNGYDKINYPNGKLLSEGPIVNGKPEGYWKTYFTTGILKSEGNRKNFLLDSVWIFYNSLGDTIQKINYLEDKKNGYFYTYNTDRSIPENIGKVLSKELYVNDSKAGKSFYYYEDGKIKEEIYYENDKKNGVGSEYDEDGRIITIKKYSNGFLTERERINRYSDKNTKEGVWYEFYNDIRIKSESYYSRGQLDGYYKEYNKEGVLTLTLLYKDGKLVEDVGRDSTKVAITEIKDNEGRVIETGLFKNNIPVGVHKKYDTAGNIITSKIYNENGVIVSEGIIDKEGKRTGNWNDYFINEKVKAQGKYINNLREGRWKFYFEDGKLEQLGNYEKGKENGEWQWYYKNGNTWRVEEFNAGNEDGIYKEYDSSGKVLVEGRYVDGVMEGDWKVSINNFYAEGKYANDFKDGKWKYFYNDGTLMFEGNYIQGNPEGDHKYYYPNGKLKEEQFYVNGIPDKHWKKYDENGNLIVVITYQDGKEYRINGTKVNLPYNSTVLIK
jgi:uncharacterized protein